MIPENVSRFIERMPKVELHIHFEGCYDASFLHYLGRKYSNTSLATLVQCQEAVRFSNPNQFFERFLYNSLLLEDIEDFEVISSRIATYLVSQNIRYVELTFAPHKYMRKGFAYPDMIKAIDNGLRAGAEDTAFSYGLIIDIVRDLGPDIGREMIKTLQAHPFPTVVGIGLGGSEAYPAKDSAEIFQLAHEIGLQKTVHAGEGKEADSIWEALRYLDPARIDHGVQAYEDESLVTYLHDNKIPLNQCVTSNVMLNVVSAFEKHPFRDFFDRGIIMTIGTDDPAYFNLTLNEEIKRLCWYQKFSIQELIVLMNNAIHSSFLPPHIKENLARECRDEIQKIAKEYDVVVE